MAAVANGATPTQHTSPSRASPLLFTGPVNTSAPAAPPPPCVFACFSLYFWVNSCVARAVFVRANVAPPPLLHELCSFERAPQAPPYLSYRYCVSGSAAPLGANPHHGAVRDQLRVTHYARPPPPHVNVNKLPPSSSKTCDNSHACRGWVRGLVLVPRERAGVTGPATTTATTATIATTATTATTRAASAQGRGGHVLDRRHIPAKSHTTRHTTPRNTHIVGLSNTRACPN